MSAIAFDKARILLQILGIGGVAAIADRVVIYPERAIARSFSLRLTIIASEPLKTCINNQPYFRFHRANEAFD